jgi:hypothetical protein
MSLPSKTLRPGLLVSLKTSITGDNVEYTKTIIEEEHIDETGALVGSWQTDKTVADAAEQELAVKVRSKARAFITGVCAKSDFGYLCPESNEAALEVAIRKAVDVCTEFNLSARITEVNCFAITGRIAADDVQAVRAIKGELNGLLETVEESIKALDVDAARAALNKATKLGMMLAPEAQKGLQETVELSRAVAVKVAKAIKAGTQAAEVIDAATLAALASSRTAFLDLDGATEVQAPADTTGRALDLEPQDSVEDEAAVAAASGNDLDLDFGDDAEPVREAAPTRELELEDMLA